MKTVPRLTPEDAKLMVQAAEKKAQEIGVDMDIAIVESVDAMIETPGSTTAPAHTLYDIVRKLPDGAQIELDTGNGDGQMTLRAGRSEFTLQTLPTEDFPQTDGGDLPHRFALPAAELMALSIARASPSRRRRRAII